MFHTLEATWDRSARRGWTTAASFTMQALSVSLLLLIPLFTIQGPPRVAWLDPRLLAPPPAPPAPAPAPRGDQAQIHSSNMDGIHIVAPPSIPERTAPIDDRGVAPVPDVSGINVPGAIGERGSGRGLLDGFGDTSVAPPPAPAPATHLVRISHWAEGNLSYRVQPAYPTLARQARIQGTVELRAIISRTGMIENLTVLSGHAMLVTAAVEAVKQWRYRPYLLNGEPIEVETEVRVNFTLSGN